MNSLRSFFYDGNEVRTVQIDNEPWFVGKDIATVLGYKDTVNAMKSHVDEEDKMGWQITTPTGSRNVNIINESGLYSLILSSKLPSAKLFKRWVTSEVLPEIRKTGQYGLTQGAPMESRALTTDDYIRAAAIISNCRNERLPYVLHLLEQGGFERPSLLQPVFDAENKAIKDTAIYLIRELHTIFNLTYAQIGALVGLDKVQISCYAAGKKKPNASRAEYITLKLRNYIEAKAADEEETI